jgi:hypothetical protein
VCRVFREFSGFQFLDACDWVVGVETLAEIRVNVADADRYWLQAVMKSGNVLAKERLEMI